jgi:hypothetical protein
MADNSVRINWKSKVMIAAVGLAMAGVSPLVSEARTAPRAQSFSYKSIRDASRLLKSLKQSRKAGGDLPLKEAQFWGNWPNYFNNWVNWLNWGNWASWLNY